MSLNLITIEPDYSIKINMIEAVANQAFKTILHRKRTMDGDADGRKKRLNTLEMVFVVLYANKWMMDSSYFAEDADKKALQIAKDIGMPKDWTPDKAVKDAIKTYLKIQNDRNPSLGILNSLQVGLKTSQRAVELYNKNTNKAIKVLDKLDKLASERDLTPDELQAMQAYSNLLGDNVDRIIKIGEKIPKTLIQIEQLVDKVREIQSSAKQARGGRRVGRREDPR